MAENVVRIAARGDGVTSSGKHVAFGVPGDRLLDDGALEPGPHHQQPPCRHYPECGGCQLQHVDDEAYRGYLISRVETALAQHDLTTEVREPHLSPLQNRRRASLRALKVGPAAIAGFNAAKSNRIVDMRECHILRPELFGLIAPLRELFGGMLPAKKTGEIQLTLLDQGVDVLLKGPEPEGYEAMEALTAFCEQNRLARLSIDQGLGPETLYEPRPATIALSGKPVGFPVGAFLQATEDGEAALLSSVRRRFRDPSARPTCSPALGRSPCRSPVRFACGRRFPRRRACAKRAAPNVAAEHRDLYRRPLDAKEINVFEAVVLDPPRAGAEEQVRVLASSESPRIAYVSCNPATFGATPSCSRRAATGSFRVRILLRRRLGRRGRRLAGDDDRRAVLQFDLAGRDDRVARLDAGQHRDLAVPALAGLDRGAERLQQRLAVGVRAVLAHDIDAVAVQRVIDRGLGQHDLDPAPAAA